MATFYINPSYAVNGDGTSPALAASPGAAGAYNTWSGITVSAGNTYLQRRGTTYAATITAGGSGSATSYINYGAYSNDTTGADDDTTQDRPKVRAASGNGFSVANRHHINVRDFDIKGQNGGGSTGIHAGTSYYVNFTRVLAEGYAYGLVITAATGSSAYARWQTYTDCDFVQSGGAGAGYAGVAMQTSGQGAAQSGYGVKNITFTDCTASGQYGWYGVSGGTTTEDSSIRDILHVRCDASDTVNTGFYYSPSVGAAKDWTTSNGTGNTNPWCYAISFDDCDAHRCGNAGVSVCSIGGYCKDSRFSAANTQGAGASTTGGAQFICNGYAVINNDVYDNTSTTTADGVGIFLDVGSMFTYIYTGCVNVKVARNRCHGNLGGASANTLAEYQSVYTPDYVTPSASGIRTFHAKNCEIVANVCYNNGSGIGIDGFTHGTRVENNVCDSNWGAGIQNSWLVTSSGNVIQNNILTNNYAGVWLGTYEDKTTTGNLTLSASAVGGGVTATSSASDFATHATAYAIREVGGNGFACIYAKTSNTVVTVEIIRAFSGTSFAHGTWKLTMGTTPDADYVGTNVFYGNTSDRIASNVGAAITEKGTDIASDPLLSPDYKTTSASPAYGVGVHYSYRMDADGHQFWNPPSIGAYEAMRAREART